MKEARKGRNIRMTDQEWADCQHLGGAEFLRRCVWVESLRLGQATALVFDHRKKTTTLTKIEAKDLK